LNYQPAAPPSDPARLAEYLNRELRRISQALAETAPVVHYAVGQLTPTTWSANNYKPPGLDGANVVRISASVTQTLTGIALTSPYRQLSLVNIGTGVIYLSSQDAASSASARFALAANLNLSANAVANLWYDPISSRWRAQSIAAPGASGGASGAAVADVQTFLADGTWTRPTGAKTVDVYVVGGGGAGASGRNSVPGIATSGGGGGRGGGTSFGTFEAASISATVTITVPAAAAGGTAVAGPSADGVNGADGGICQFGNMVAARGGQGGVGGTTSTTTGGAALGQGDVTTGLDGGGGRAAIAGLTGVSGLNLEPPRRCGGGGGGGGVNSGTTETAGGTSSDLTFGLVYTGQYQVAGGTTAGGNGAAGVAFGGNRGVGGGGGGGGGGNAVNGGTGGAGAVPGGGGGGGGGSRSGLNSGAGGAGGRGLVIVVTYF